MPPDALAISASNASRVAFKTRHIDARDNKSISSFETTGTQFYQDMVTVKRVVDDEEDVAANPESETSAWSRVKDSLLVQRKKLQKLWVQAASGAMKMRKSWRWFAPLSPESTQSEAVPLRTSAQLMIVFMVVFATIITCWTMFFLVRLIQTRVSGGESPKMLRLSLFGLSLSLCSWGMTVANKYVILRIQSPSFVVAVQMTISVVVSIILAGGQLSFESKQVRMWIIVPFIACVQLWTSLYTMEHLTLSMLMIIRNLGPLVTLPIETFVMPTDVKRPVVSCASVCALCLVLASAATYMGGQPPSGKGVVFALINMVLAVIDAVVRRRLLTRECAEMSPTMCMLLNNLVGIVPSILLCFLTGELVDLDPTVAFSRHTVVILLISGVIGAGISFFALNVQRELTATSFMVLENGIRLAEVLAGVYMFKDPFTMPSHISGLLISYCGSAWYAKVQNGGDPKGHKLEG